MDKSGGGKLGINGFGRIGKLTVWHHVGRKYFDELVVNIGREAGTSLADIAHYAERDSTYGLLQNFLGGYAAGPVIEALDEEAGTMMINGMKVTFLRTHRNPAEIRWAEHGVDVVVDTTGQFLDPSLPGDHPKGAIRGHIDAGAKKVIASAPFKIKDKSAAMPEDAVTTVMGINGDDYDSAKHAIVSNASCTTTCLAHMIKPVLDACGAEKILSASMATIHAATGSQAVLDKLPGTGKPDLRKSRSILNNIILTSTGAAKALKLVIPEMGEIGFIAESVRVPTTTGSLIILGLNIQDNVTAEQINEIYRAAAEKDENGYLLYSDKQNVSGDIIGTPRAAAVIEGLENEAFASEATIDLSAVPGLDEKVLAALPETKVKVPVTQAVIYAWYDNEMGSYVNLLGDRTVSIAEAL